MLNDLTGKVALVTGGAERAGRAFSLTFAKAGADIVATYYRTEEAAAKTKAEIEAMGRRCTMIEADISDIDAMKKVVEQVEKEYGRLDVLMHNAANFNQAPFLEVTPEHFDSSFGILLRGPFFLSQYAIPLMLKNGGGKILAMVGNSATETWPDRVPHTLAKNSMIKLIESLAIGFSPEIQCYALSPNSFFKVDTDQYLPNYDDKYNFVNGYKLTNGSIDPVAELALFLATCQSYLTGVAIPIDGGLHLMRGLNAEQTDPASSSIADVYKKKEEAQGLR